MRKFILLATAALSACQTVPSSHQEPIAIEHDPLYTLLAEAKTDVDKAYQILAETKNAMATQMLSEQERELAFERATAIPDGFEKHVTLENWYGPLDSLAYQIASWTNYKVEIYKAPVDMPMVRINYRDVPVFKIYQQLRVQVGDRAIVSTDKNILKIVYPELGE